MATYVWGRTRTGIGITNDELVVLHRDGGDGLNIDALLRRLRVRAVVRRGGVLWRVGRMGWVGVAVWHVCRVWVVEGDGIMALVDMVCVHDMGVARIARG